MFIVYYPPPPFLNEDTSNITCMLMMIVILLQPAILSWQHSACHVWLQEYYSSGVSPVRTYYSSFDSNVMRQGKNQ